MVFIIKKAEKKDRINRLQVIDRIDLTGKTLTAN